MTIHGDGGMIEVSYNEKTLNSPDQRMLPRSLFRSRMGIRPVASTRFSMKFPAT